MSDQRANQSATVVRMCTWLTDFPIKRVPIQDVGMVSGLASSPDHVPNLTVCPATLPAQVLSLDLAFAFTCNDFS